MIELAKRVLDILGRAGAAAFWTAAITVFVLWAAGFVPKERITGTAAVLGGDAEAVPVQRLKALEAAEEELSALKKEQARRPTYRLLMQARQALERQRREMEQDLQRDRERLAAWQAFVKNVQAEIDEKYAMLKAERERFDALLASNRSEVLSRADSKVLSIYGQMDASQVAEDLVARYRAGEVDGAVHILSLMPERKAAEVLSEISDPAVRSRLLSDLREKMLSPLKDAEAALSARPGSVTGGTAP